MRTLLLASTLLITLGCFSQITKISEIDITPPLEIPMYLSGTFGELRSNHFHSGIDIKTQGVEGKNVIAIADGWVSRVKISEGGYGKAIYITHPNGYVSVYGHLQKFNSRIQKLVIEKQYNVESYTVQLFPKKDEIKVKKGDIIAYSGNTGGSMGPHLHFEIREERTQYPVNPLLNKSIKIKDYYRPSITKLAIYPVDNNSIIDGKHDTLFLDISGWGVKHYVKNKPEITASGRVSFGISAIDLMNNISNKNGVYSTKLYQDSVLIFHLEMDKLSFKTTRFINSLIDYSYFTKTKKRIVRTQIDTINIFDNYQTIENNGVIELNDTLVHNFTYEVTDAYNNISKLNFSIKGSTDTIDVKTDEQSGTFFGFSKSNSIIDDSIRVKFEANSFYRSFYFDYDKYNSDSISYSSVYKLHNSFTPVHKYFTIEILPDSISDNLKDKLYISYSADSNDFWYMGSDKKGDYITCRSRQLGYYKVMIDTTAPEIKEVNFYNNKAISKQKSLKIKFYEKQSGIKSYRATLNDEWILMEYDSKKNLLIYAYDDRLKKGKNEFKLVVIDLLDNVSEYKCNLIY